MLRTLGTSAALLLVGSLALAQEPPPMPPMPGGPPGMGGGDERSGPENVTLATADGLDIAATAWRAEEEGGAGVVLLHMYRSDRSAWGPLVRELRDRGLTVLAIDLRGHGESATQDGKDLSKRVEERDAELFGAMHADALAAVDWLVEEAGCDGERIGLVGASVGCSVAIDTARRHPDRVAAVACMTPGAEYLGVDTLAHLEELPAEKPLLCLSHESELAAGATAIVEKRPTTALITYDQAAPDDAGRGWAHGTRMFGNIPFVDHTVASFIAARTGSPHEAVVLDGALTASGAAADDWSEAQPVTYPGSSGSVKAFRVGRRILFSGSVPLSMHGLRFQVSTGAPGSGAPTAGPPQIVAVDLDKQRWTWTFGGMGSMPNLPGMSPRDLFGKTHPQFRVVEGEERRTFEGEWFIPKMGEDSSLIDLVVWVDARPAPRQGPGVPGDIENLVRLRDRAAE